MTTPASEPHAADNHLLSEILEQPSVLHRVLEHYVAAPSPALVEAARVIRRAHRVVFAGMVTSEFAGYGAAVQLSQDGRSSCVFDASELLYYHLPALRRARNCLVLVSQSGNSAEVVRLLDETRGQLPIIGVYNDETSYLARHCDIGLPILAGPQLACGTKTNLASMAVLLLLAEQVVYDSVAKSSAPLLGAATSVSEFLANWESHVAPIADLLERSPYTVFLGRGPGHASAMFSAGIFREVPKVVADGMSAASFRHGMWEMIRPDHRAVIFAPDGPATHHLAALAADVERLGARTLVVTNTSTVFEGSDVLRMPAIPELWSPLVDTVPLQLAAYTLAQRSGLEPGRLVISSYVTQVE